MGTCRMHECVHMVISFRDTLGHSNSQETDDSPIAPEYISDTHLNPPRQTQYFPVVEPTYAFGSNKEELDR